MKRILILISFCLSINLLSAQTLNSLTGVFKFEKAELTITNYNTNEIVEQLIINDIDDIDINNVHLEKLFLELDFMNGEIDECVLIDKKQYRLDDKMQFQSALNAKKDELSSQYELLADDHLFIGKELPLYIISEDDEKLTITYPKYNFGQSDINFTMQADLVLTMTKQTIK